MFYTTKCTCDHFTQQECIRKDCIIDMSQYHQQCDGSIISLPLRITSNALEQITFCRNSIIIWWSYDDHMKSLQRRVLSEAVHCGGSLLFFPSLRITHLLLLYFAPSHLHPCNGNHRHHDHHQDWNCILPLQKPAASALTLLSAPRFKL